MKALPKIKRSRIALSAWLALLNQECPEWIFLFGFGNGFQSGVIRANYLFAPDDYELPLVLWQQFIVVAHEKIKLSFQWVLHSASYGKDMSCSVCLVKPKTNARLARFHHAIS